MSKRKNVRQKNQETATEEYAVEKVLNKRFVAGKVEYLLKWKGYPLSDCTWEPFEHINAKELIDDFEKHNDAKGVLPNYVITTERDVAVILGITRMYGELEFLVKYRDGNALLVPAKFANVRYPMRVIEFYESNLKIIPTADDESTGKV
ncbi:unnamed protein product [Auanema sp. JU1783]|nr:unnamed protein product [Auanema sp. JU1783]